MGNFSAARRCGGRSVGLTRLRTRARMSSLAALAAASVAVVLLLVASPTSATAAPEPTPPALVSPAPEITSPTADSFLGTASSTITGKAAPGSTVQILAGSSRTSVCTARTTSDGAFECVVSRLPSGPDVPLTAVQLVDGAANVESATVKVDILAPPTIAGTSPLLTNGLIQGASYPGAEITLSMADGTSWTFPSGPDGAWAYVLPRTLPSGDYSLTATQSTTFSSPDRSEPSAERTITLDLVPPNAPSLASPRAGSTIPPDGAVYAGTGETGATVNVYALTASGYDVTLCSAVVSRSAWRCTGEKLPAGPVTVTAYQTDAAGNVGAGSASRNVTVAKAPAAAPAPVPSPAPRDEPSTAPVVPTAPPSEPPAPSPAPGVPADAKPPGSWEAATPFTAAVPPALGATDLSWLRALVLAAVAILLLLVPARMLATTVRAGRARRAPLSLTGRNRARTYDDPAPVLTGPGERATSVLVVAVAGAILLFANPVLGEPEYLRVLLASVIAVAAINVAATLGPAALARRSPSGPASVAVSPRLLMTVAAVALLSRVLELQPALLFGIVFTVGAISATRSARGIVAWLRIGAVFTAGLLAWLTSTLIGSPSGFLGSLLVETVNIAAMAGIGSAAVLLIPLGRLDGRALLVWSRPAWFASATVVLTVLFALLAPVFDVWQMSGDVTVAFLVVLGFGALGVTLWIWRRAIQPVLTSN